MNCRNPTGLIRAIPPIFLTTPMDRLVTSSRNPTVLIREIPPVRTDDYPYCTDECLSQSHRTDQGNSEGERSYGADYNMQPGESQSHHTDQGNSESHLPNPLTLKPLK